MEVESERGQTLHDRVCRGETLTQEERAELDHWYAESDREEAESLGNSLTEPQSNEELRAEIRKRLRDLQAAIEHIRRMEESNESLRSTNDTLKQQLVNRGILASG